MSMSHTGMNVNILPRMFERERIIMYSSSDEKDHVRNNGTQGKVNYLQILSSDFKSTVYVNVRRCLQLELMMKLILYSVSVNEQC